MSRPVFVGEAPGRGGSKNCYPRYNDSTNRKLAETFLKEVFGCE